MDAEEAHVPDRTKRLDDLRNPRSAQQLRIDHGQQNVGNLRVLGNVADSGADVGVRLVILLHEEALAEAVTALSVADLCAHWQEGVRILVL